MNQEDDGPPTRESKKSRKLELEELKRQKKAKEQKRRMQMIAIKKSNFFGNEIYSEMIRTTINLMRTLMNAEEEEKENRKM